MAFVNVVSRCAAWFLAYVACAYVGRATIIDGQALSLMWPAAGVGALWVASGWGRRVLVADLGGLAAATCLVNASTGVAPDLVAVFVVVNLVQPLVFVGLVRHARPDARGLGGARTISRVEDLTALSSCAAAACLVGAGVGHLGLTLVVGAQEPGTLVAWWGRNTVGLLVLVTLGLLLGPRLLDVRRGIAPLVLPSLERLRDAALVGAVSVAVATGVFWRPEQPLAFVLLFTTVVAGLRLGPVCTALHGFLSGSVAVALTIAGMGPFAGIEDPLTRAVVAQVFVALTVLTGLMLAFYRTERDAAVTQLEGERTAATDRAALLAAVLETMREGITVVDETGSAVLRNPAGRRMLGLSPEQETASVDPGSLHLLTAGGEPVAPAHLPSVRALAGEELVATDYVQHVPGTRPRTVEISAAPLPASRPGGPTRAVIAFRDVTEAREQRHDLETFAGVVAHDLANPLGAITGWAEALEDCLTDRPADLDPALEMVRHVRGTGARMQALIDDLLAWTLARDSALQPAPVDLSALAESAAHGLRAGAVAATVDVDPGLHAVGDERFLRQLLANLLGNAVKYVAPGVHPHVRVSGQVVEHRLRVEVEDNGIGVPEDHRAAIFETFHRAHPDAYAGTGLGLGICRTVVERHGGSIEVLTARDGHGSRFVFTLPVDPTPAAPTSAAVTAAHSPA